MPECSVAISHVVCFRRCVATAKSIGIAALAVVTTNIAAATGMLTYLSFDALYGKKSMMACEFTFSTPAERGLFQTAALWGWGSCGPLGAATRSPHRRGPFRFFFATRLGS